ncbi:MAG: porin family protein [Dysgonamonadaceae bacterium]|jgi:hypothetical protein|nr:porin family protein [Dysgonamonadaceae bacterium]
MKKTVLIILLFTGLAVRAFSQAGDVTVGLKSGWTTGYENLLYGFDAAYNLTGSLEIAFTGVMNPNISQKDDLAVAAERISKLSVYSGNLDARLYLLSTRTWGIGPALGGQYFSVKSKTNENKNIDALGFNIGIHGKINLTDNLLLNGGWRYTNAKEEYPEMKYHFIYLGVAFTFQSR